MRLQQSAQLHWVGQQAHLLPIAGCSACTNSCSASSGLVQSTPALNPELNLNLVDLIGAPGPGQVVAVTLESGALNRYAALVFGLPLVALFVLAGLADSTPISSPAQVSFALLVIASLLLIVTLLCRSVARQFESRLKLEIRE